MVDRFIPERFGLLLTSFYVVRHSPSGDTTAGPFEVAVPRDLPLSYNYQKSGTFNLADQGLHYFTHPCTFLLLSETLYL
jgi:hypothetical protein